MFIVLLFDLASYVVETSSVASNRYPVRSLVFCMHFKDTNTYTSCVFRSRIFPLSFLHLNPAPLTPGCIFCISESKCSMFITHFEGKTHTSWKRKMRTSDEREKKHDLNCETKSSAIKTHIFLSLFSLLSNTTLTHIFGATKRYTRTSESPSPPLNTN